MPLAAVNVTFMEILDLELEDGPYECDPDEEELVEFLPKGSGPVLIADTGLEQAVLFTKGPLEGYVAATDSAEWAHLVARSIDEFITALQNPVNWETPPDEEDDEDGELVGLFDLLDGFADGSRTPADIAAGEALLGTLPKKDVWSARYATQATWGAKLTMTSSEDAQAAIDAIDAAEGSDSDSTPQRWAGEAGEAYLADLDRWGEALAQ